MASETTYTSKRITFLISVIKVIGIFGGGGGGGGYPLVPPSPLNKSADVHNFCCQIAFPCKFPIGPSSLCPCLSYDFPPASSNVVWLCISMHVCQHSYS